MKTLNEKREKIKCKRYCVIIQISPANENLKWVDMDTFKILCTMVSYCLTLF